MRPLITLVLLLAALGLSSCTRPNQATQVLENAGYTAVEIGGYAFFNCSKDDGFRTRFKAAGPTGRPVSGAVCSGLLKGSTIRLD